MPSNTTSIGYLALDKKNSSSSDNAIKIGDTLLTFSKRIPSYPLPPGPPTSDSGTITGKIPPTSNIQATAREGRSVQSRPFRPYPIGIGDALRRNGNRNGITFDIRDINRAFEIDE
jgi:hypothetical protein